MKCPNCGTELPNESIFCSSCGTKISTGNAELIENASTGSADNDSFKNNSDNNNDKFVKPIKKKKNKFVGGIVGVLIAVVLLVFIVKGLLSGGSKSDNAYVYISNGKYELLTNLKKNIPIEISSSKSENTNIDQVSFSPDGKYVYYFTKYDEWNYAGSLCKAEYAKLKEDSSKNEKYIEIIASNVRLGFKLLDDGTIIYADGDGGLYYYNGNESTQIAKSVNDYYIDGSNRIIYEIGARDDNTLYGVSLNDIENKRKLASNYHSLYYCEDFSNIYYVKYNDDKYTLYVTGFEKEAEKIADSADVIKTSEGTIFFTAENGTMLNLYDYVEDVYAENDPEIKEPYLDDYSIPIYTYNKMDADCNPDDYDTIYTSCTNPVAFIHSWFSYYSLDQYYDSAAEEKKKYYKAFIDKYKSQENGEGYIVVTDEVKQDLITLVEHCGQGYENEWLEVCFYKEQSGTDYNYASYNADLDMYNSAQERIALREDLKDKSYAFPVSNLYSYKDGTLTLLYENMLTTYTCMKGVMFNTPEMVTETLPIDEITSIAEVRDLFYLKHDALNYLASFDGCDISQMSENAADTYHRIFEKGFECTYIFDKYVCLDGASEGIFVADITNGVVGDFDIICNEGGIYGVKDKVLYYYCNTYESGDNSYYDAYSYVDGKSTCLAKDVMWSNVNIYDDNVVLAYTGLNQNHGHELTLFEGGEERSSIAEDVTEYIRIDKSKFLYISDNDLYCFDGKEKKLIQSDVDIFWTLSKMGVKYTFGNEYGFHSHSDEYDD